MNQTVNAGWYVKKCALGALIGLTIELLLLAVIAALMLQGAIGDGAAGAAVLFAATLGTFAGCAFAGTRTSRKTEIILLCAALCWVLAQVIGFLSCDTLEPSRSLMLAAAMAAGAAGALLLRGGKKKRKTRSAARRGHR